MRYRYRCHAWVLLLFLVFQTAFSQPPGVPTESYGDELHIGLLGETEIGLNPFQSSTTAHQELIQLIFGYGLTKTPDKILNPPDLIERYIVNPSKKDSRVWHILLDRNINFHDGLNLRNTDVKFTFELVKKYGGFILNREFDFSNLKSITTRGDLEVIFELYQPDEQFGAKISDIPIISENYYQTAMAQGYRVFSHKRPMGMGPFIFEDLAGNVLTLKYHPHYYSGRPFLDKVKVYFFKDEQEMIDALVNGQVDYIEFPDRTTMYRILELMAGKIVVFSVPRPETKLYTLLFNLNRFPLSEPEVRTAISLALNRQDIMERVMLDVGKIANTLIPETNPFYERTLYRENYSPQQALQTLLDAGWQLNRQSGILEKGGQPLSFKLYFTQNSYLEESIARMIKVDLAELNINVEPVPVLPDARESLLQRSNYMAMIYHYSYNPRHLFEAFTQFYFDVLGAGQKAPNYQNRYLTRLHDLVEGKEELHKNFYQRFQKFVVNEIPAVFLFFDELILVGVDKRFQNYRSIYQENRKYFYRINPVENWYVPKDLQKYDK